MGRVEFLCGTYIPRFSIVWWSSQVWAQVCAQACVNAPGGGWETRGLKSPGIKSRVCDKDPKNQVFPMQLTVGGEPFQCMIPLFRHRKVNRVGVFGALGKPDRRAVGSHSLLLIFKKSSWTIHYFVRHASRFGGDQSEQNGKRILSSCQLPQRTRVLPSVTHNPLCH